MHIKTGLEVPCMFIYKTKLDSNFQLNSDNSRPAFHLHEYLVGQLIVVLMGDSFLLGGV